MYSYTFISWNRIKHQMMMWKMCYYIITFDMLQQNGIKFDKLYLYCIVFISKYNKYCFVILIICIIFYLISVVYCYSVKICNSFTVFSYTFSVYFSSSALCFDILKFFFFFWQQQKIIIKMKCRFIMEHYV